MGFKILVEPGADGVKHNNIMENNTINQKAIGLPVKLCERKAA